MKPRLKLDVYSHHVAVTNNSYDVKRIVTGFALQAAEYHYFKDQRSGVFTSKVSRIFAAATADRKIHRFHINQLDELKLHLKRHNIRETDMEITHHPLYEPAPAHFNMTTTKTPLPQQIPIISELVGGTHTRVVTLQTGKGKTFCATTAISLLRTRAVMIVQAMYIGQWLKELTGKDPLTDMSIDDVLVVQGSSELKKLIELALSDALDVPFIIISNTTFYNFIEDYEYGNGVMSRYGCTPIEFFKVIGAGVRLIDEVHAMFHRYYVFDLYTHIPYTISLTATLISKSKVVTDAMATMFPMETRVNTGAYDQYISVVALKYSFEKPDRMRWMRQGIGSYSNVVLEESIMSRQGTQRNYLNLITNCIQKTYMAVREEGQRMLIFAETVALCHVIEDHLTSILPNMITRSYVSGDPMSHLLESDIIVSTLKSAGTGRDIPGLRHVLMTNALDTPSGNLQALGRLRKLKDWPDVTPEFMYLVCIDIEQHMRYHQSKLECFKGRALTHTTTNLTHKV